MTPQRRRIRAQAARWFAEGRSRAWVASRVDVSRATASRWYRTWIEGGATALASGRATGRRPRLSTDQEATIVRLLLRSPREAGVEAETWSLAAIAYAIHQTTGERFHRRHVGRLARRLGWAIAPVGRYARRAFLRVPLHGPEGVPHALHVQPRHRPPGAVG